MQRAVHNRVPLQVADTMEVSGRATAESVKRGFSAKKQSALLHICALAILGSVVSVGVLAALAPATALAAEGGVPGEIAALKKEVAALQSQVEALQDQLAAVRSNNALKLGPFVSVDPHPENGVRGPNITFKGANVHIVSGSGATDDNLSHGGTLTGLGNLIIGYDEVFDGLVVNRGGSHNLVIGRFHSFTSSAFGGLVAGEQNTISAEEASVSGGSENIASGNWASVSGGLFNQAAFDADSVSGGNFNIASGGSASVTGGQGNTASGDSASVSGGLNNQSVGQDTSVLGGINNVAEGSSSSVSGGELNFVSGTGASVTGGSLGSATGDLSVVLGGSTNIASKTGSIAPHPPFP